MALPPDHVVDELRSVLDDRAVLVGDDTESFLVDQRQARLAATADAVVVSPADTAGVAAAVTVCAAHGVAIVPHGGNTGLSLGTILPTDRPAILLSLSRLNQITSVDADRWIINLPSAM